ncbi:MAG: hypothetical protein HOF01_03685 [Chloroflexi bacterium]|nr:hypothetical protein [Chloroflexota bacterium]
MTMWKLSWKLASEQKTLLAFAISATLIAASIAVGMTQYLGGIETATLEHEFARYSDAQTNGWVKAREISFNPAAFESIGKEVDIAADELGSIGRLEMAIIRSAPYSISSLEDERFAQYSNLYMQASPGDEFPVRYISGSSPPRGSSRVAIPSDVAEVTGSSVGDVVVIQDTSREEFFELEIAGIYEPLGSSDSRWADISRDLLTADTASAGPAFIAIVDPEILFTTLSGRSSTLGTGWWLISVDPSSVIEAGIDSSLERIEVFSKQANSVSPEAQVFVGAKAPLQKIRRDRSAQIIPVALSAVLLLLVAGQVVLLSGSAMTSSIKNSVSRVGLRGGNALSLLILGLAPAIVVLVIPALLAPLLAWSIVPLLGTVEALDPLTNGARLAIPLTVGNFVISVGIGILSALNILRPSIQLLVLRKLPKSTRDLSALAPWLWRMKIDLLIVAVSALVLWEMNARDLLSASAETGGSSIGWIMTSTGIVAVSAMLAIVRAWPVFPRIIANVFGRTSPTVWYAITSMRRSSFRHAWLLTLVTIVTITAVADSTIAKSLEANGIYAAAQTAGGDARIVGFNGYKGASNPAIQQLIAGEYIDQWTPALRTKGALGANGEGADLNLLAVDPDALSKLLVDDSMRSVAQQAAQMLNSESNPASQPAKIMLPPDTVSLSMTGGLSEPFIDIWSRIKGADGTTTTILMIPVQDQSSGADFGSGTFIGAIENESNGPYELLSILIYEPPVGPVGHKVTLSIENLEAITGSGAVRTIDQFESTDSWYALPTTAGIDETRIEPNSGSQGSVQAYFGSGTDDGIRGFHSRSDLQHLPILIGDKFEKSSGLSADDTGFITVFGKVVPIKVIGVLDTFATLDPGSSFTVIDYQTLLDFLALKIDPVLPNSAEVFITTSGESVQDPRTLIEGVDEHDLQVFEFERLVSNSTASAGASAGWKGMHLVVTLTTGFLMLTGLMLFIRLDFYETGLSSDILSALGVTKLGIVVEKLVRLGIVAVVGIGAGLLLGGALGSFVSERIADVYASDTTEAASRAATIGFDTAYYVVTLLVFGLIGMLVFALSQGRRQVIGYQGRSD